MLRQLSDHNDIMNSKIQTMRVTINDRLVISERMRATTQAPQLENISITINASVNSSEDDEKVKVENNLREDKGKEIK